MHDSDDGLTKLASQGDSAAFEALLAACRPRLTRLVSLKLDRRITARVDPSDVVQDTLTQAYLHREQFKGDAHASFYAWLRGIACHRLVDLQRRHIGAARRTVLRENPTRLPSLNDPSSSHSTDLFADSGVSPQRQIERVENKAKLIQSLQQLGKSDRELLVMRHFERMSIDEIAEALGISRSNVTTRHLRALQRLLKCFSRMDK